MASFKVDDNVTLKKPLPGSEDHVGTITGLEQDGTVWMQWAGHEAPPKATRFSVHALERVEDEQPLPGGLRV